MDPCQPPTDGELVRQARSGDDRAFHNLVDRHAGYIYALAVRLSRTPHDAEDLMQETFAGAFGRLWAFKGLSSFKTWLTRILINQSARRHRDNRLRRFIPLDAVNTPAEPSGQAKTDLRLDLAQAFLSLSDEHREVIVLRELQGLSYEQMASALGVPRGTVESRLFRARRELQELLKDHLE